MTSNAAIESVLVHVGFDRVGDGLLKLPFVRGLKVAFPGAHVTWLSGREDSVYSGVLAPAVDGLIDEIVEDAGVGVSPRELLGGRVRALAGKRFDLVIDTQRIFWVSLSATRIPHRLFLSPAARFLLSDFKPKKGYRPPRTMQRQLLDLLEIAAGRSFPTPERLELAIPPDVEAAARRLLPEGADYVGFAPGSGGPPKCWPLDRFIEVARGETTRGRVPVFLLGPKEVDWLQEIREAVPGALFPLQDAEVANTFGFSPYLTVALAARLDRALSNDSGAGHMLSIGGAPVVILYGVTSPDKFMPMTDKLTILRAQDFGGAEMRFIPVDAAEAALENAGRA